RCSRRLRELMLIGGWQGVFEPLDHVFRLIKHLDVDPVKPAKLEIIEVISDALNDEQIFSANRRQIEIATLRANHKICRVECFKLKAISICSIAAFRIGASQVVLEDPLIV